LQGAHHSRIYSIFKKAELPSWYLNKHFTHIIAGMVGLKMDFAVLLIAGIMVTSFTLVPK
jgi:hypothetical protein